MRMMIRVFVNVSTAVIISVKSSCAFNSIHFSRVSDVHFSLPIKLQFSDPLFARQNGPLTIKSFILTFDVKCILAILTCKKWTSEFNVSEAGGPELG